MEFPNPGIMLKSKIPLSKFAGLIGFVKQFTNQAASHLKARRALWVVQNGRFL